MVWRGWLGTGAPGARAYLEGDTGAAGVVETDGRTADSAALDCIPAARTRLRPASLV